MRHSGQEGADPYDLEIGDLAKLFWMKGADRDVRKRVQKLHKARNLLAHLKPLYPDAVLRLIEANEGQC